MQFEQFTEAKQAGGGTGTPIPFCSIDSHGYATISAVAVKEYSLFDYTWVDLYYSSADDAIGFKFINTPGAYSRKLNIKENEIRICLVSFLKHYNKWHNEKKRYPVSWESGMLVIRIG